MEYREFWKFNSYAVVGNSARKSFPKLTYGKLKELGKTVFAVDPGTPEGIDETIWPDLVSLPQKPDAVILELPKDETAAAVQQIIDAGIANVWIHQGCDTPEALELARKNQLILWHGTCAVMYLSSGFSMHAVHGWINKALGKF